MAMFSGLLLMVRLVEAVSMIKYIDSISGPIGRC